MKKRIVVLVGFIIIILFVFLLASCNGIREYKVPKIKQLHMKLLILMVVLNTHLF